MCIIIRYKLFIIYVIAFEEDKKNRLVLSDSTFFEGSSYTSKRKKIKCDGLVKAPRLQLDVNQQKTVIIYTHQLLYSSFVQTSLTSFISSLTEYITLYTSLYHCFLRIHAYDYKRKHNIIALLFNLFSVSAFELHILKPIVKV